MWIQPYLSISLNKMQPIRNPLSVKKMSTPISPFAMVRAYKLKILVCFWHVSKLGLRKRAQCMKTIMMTAIARTPSSGSRDDGRRTNMLLNASFLFEQQKILQNDSFYFTTIISVSLAPAFYSPTLSFTRFVSSSGDDI